MAISNAADQGGDNERDEKALKKTLRLSPVAQVDLPGLEEVEAVIVVVAEPHPLWVRWTEGITVHVVANGVVAVVAFLAGRFFPI